MSTGEYIIPVDTEFHELWTTAIKKMDLKIREGTMQPEGTINIPIAKFEALLHHVQQLERMVHSLSTRLDTEVYYSIPKIKISSLSPEPF